MKRYALALRVVVLLMFAAPPEILAVELVPPGLNAKQRKVFTDLSAELNNDIVLFGRVVDLDGNPVPDATVRIGARVAGALPGREFPVVEVQTDATGSFVAKTFGELVSLKEIVKDGYQYRYQYNSDRMLRSAKPDKRRGHGFEPDKPFTFHVRKLGPPAFVVIHNMTFGKKVGVPSMFDLIKRQWVHREADIIAMQYSSVDRDWHTDIKLWVEGEPGKMRLILESPDPESGFVVEKHAFAEVMIEAPEHGYRPRLEIPVKSGGSPLDAYVKCQGGLFYARLHVEFNEQVPGGIWINSTSFTNLSGGRGLEYIPSVESQYDEEVFGERTRKRVRRADLLTGTPVVLPKEKK